MIWSSCLTRSAVRGRERERGGDRGQKVLMFVAGSLKSLALSRIQYQQEMGPGELSGSKSRNNESMMYRGLVFEESAGSPFTDAVGKALDTMRE